ncbi:MAG: Flavoredoxin [Desulfotomaculum sp. 46_296]|nr:MAG: Flavoredoxin [Desulfotomaculum sp. 46_296]
MSKVAVGADNFLYPMPMVLVGANVGGKPNFLAVAFFSAIQMKPPILAVSLKKIRYTNDGIKENKTFSVNIPSVELMEAVDYCGIKSGKNTDKSGVFETFYGKLETAPMIKNCPVCMECKLIEVVDIVTDNIVFVGEVVETYTDDQYLTGGVVDLIKTNPFLFSIRDKKYVSIGERIGSAWEAGKNYK